MTPVDIFNQRYDFLQNLIDFTDIPFMELPQEEAGRILKQHTDSVFLFDRQLSLYQNSNHYQLYVANCTAQKKSSSSCHYLVVQGGFGSAITRVYGPINLNK